MVACIHCVFLSGFMNVVLEGVEWGKECDWKRQQGQCGNWPALKSSDWASNLLLFHSSDVPRFLFLSGPAAADSPRPCNLGTAFPPLQDGYAGSILSLSGGGVRIFQHFPHFCAFFLILPFSAFFRIFLILRNFFGRAFFSALFYPNNFFLEIIFKKVSKHGQNGSKLKNSKIFVIQNFIQNHIF